MSDIAAFSYPNCGEDSVTVLERNANLIHLPGHGESSNGEREGDFGNYARINLDSCDDKASLHNLIDLDAPPAFVKAEGSSGVLQAYSQWLTNGTAATLHEFIASDYCANYPVAKQVLSGVKSLFEAKDDLLAAVNTKVNNMECLHQYASVSDWESSLVRAVASHCHRQLLAVAYKDDTIKTFGFGRSNNTPVRVLKDKSQKDVLCLAWRPLASFSLAAGCNEGIQIWNISHHKAAARPGSGSSRFLSDEGHSPVVSLSWSQNGKHLASASPYDGAVMVWDVSQATCCKLQKISGGNALLRWSPCDTRMLVGSCHSVFRIWNTTHWTSEKWTNLNGRCKAACWSHCGRVLVFAVENEAAIYYLKFSSANQVNPSQMMTSDVAVKCFDTEAREFKTKTGITRIGGLIKEMTWDASSSRLAVSFVDHGKSVQPVVALFRTQIDPIFEMTPSGFIVDAGCRPQAMTFLNDFAGGALLSVCWSNGYLATVPLYFNNTLTTSKWSSDNAEQQDAWTSPSQHPTMQPSDTMTILGDNFNQKNLLSVE